MNYLLVGADSAIGKKIAEQLNHKGHKVIMTSRREQSSGQSGILYFDAINSELLALPNIPLHGLVYLPGTITLKPFIKLTQQDFLKDFQINVMGAVKVIQQSLPNLRKAGNASILLFSSVAVSKGMAYHSSISSAKAAVEGLGLSLAAELAPYVRVNIIAPSLTDTPLASRLLSNEQRRTAAKLRHPLKDIGNPEEIAKLAVFLLSNHCSWITGQVMAIDGGLSTVAV